MLIAFLVVGCSSTPPATSQASQGVDTLPGDPVITAPDFHEDLRAASRRHVHRTPAGSCVVVTPPPPSWALRPDGTVKHPSEIHRPKDGNDQILFLNFEGPEMSPGQDDPENNQSHIPWQAVDMPAFDETPHLTDVLHNRALVIDAIVQWVTYYYAHMGVKVVSQRPPTGWPYTMMVIGGTPQDIGESEGVLGIATFDCYQDKRNVGFVFSAANGHGRLETLVLTIVHEAGHTFGLAHINSSESIMYPANPMGDAYWGSASTTDSYACDGSSSQDSFAVLQEMLGTRTDSIPPWVEIRSPGPGAVVPAALHALVHGSDNVMLYSVELFVDGASVGSETVPEFSFALSGLLDGPHELYAVGEDAHGNQAQSDVITVEVEADCGALADCSEGLLPIGDVCVTGADCQSGVCAQTPEGTAVCSRPCGEDSPCPFGSFCVQQEAGTTGQVVAWCAVGSAPVVLIAADGPNKLSGCATGTGSGAWLLLGLLLWLGWRRRC